MNLYKLIIFPFQEDQAINQIEPRPKFYGLMPDYWKQQDASGTQDHRLYSRYKELLKESRTHFAEMETMIMKVQVPTSGRSKYYTGMTTEMLEQYELPPAKGIWALNTDRLLKVACQMERVGVFSSIQENEETEYDQTNIRVGPQGVIWDDNSNVDVEVALSDLDINKINIFDDDQLSVTPNLDVQNLKWADQSVGGSTAPYFEENEESLTTPLDPRNFRKASHFNGRPFASWGSLFGPLYASRIMPLAPLTQKFWWQMARDMVPADTNSTGQIKRSMVEKIKVALKPHIDGQIWNETVKKQIANARSSTMNELDCKEMRSQLQEGYKLKFPSSTGMFDTKFYKYVRGEYIPRTNFTEDNHQKYGDRRDTNKRIK